MSNDQHFILEPEAVRRLEPYDIPYPDHRMTRSAKEAAAAAQDARLGVNAGHDLNLQNLELFLNNVDEVLEVSIGHALIAEALEMGLYETVKEYLKI